MRKFLSIALSLLIVFSVIPAFAITAAAYEDSTVCVIGSTEYTKLLGENGALEAANDDDTIVLVNDVSESASSTISKSVTIDLAGYKLTYSGTSTAITTSANLTIRSTVDGNGENNTEAKAAVAYTGVIVKSSGSIVDISNISGKANACVSIAEMTNEAGKIICNDSVLDTSNSSRIYPINFNYKGFAEFTNVDITINADWHDKAYITMGSGFNGTFTNCNITATNGGKLLIADADTNVTFKGCKVSEGGWDKPTVLHISNGTVKLTDGTVIDGRGRQSTVVTIDNGTLITDDASIQGDKGSDSSKITLKVNGGKLDLGKTKIIKGGNKASLLVNNNEALANGFKEDYIAYSSSEYTTKTILKKTANFQKVNAIYIDKCEHFKTTAGCEEPGTCKYCGKEVEAVGHLWEELKYNDTQHWKVCSKCGEADVAEDHKGGTATCTIKAVCDVCNQEYGEPLGHLFVNYKEVSPAICNHNTVKVAACERGCSQVNYDYSEATNVVVTKEKIEPTCVKSGKTEELCCSECGKLIKSAETIPATGHSYGDEIVISEPTYVVPGKAKKICTVCSDEYEYDLPKKSVDKSTVAIIASSETEVAQYQQVFGTSGAIANAKDGDTIILTKNIEEDESSVITDKKLTLDLAGYSLTYEGIDPAVTTNSDFTLRSTVDGLGVTNTTTPAVNYICPLIKTDAVATISNISGVATAPDASIVLATADTTKIIAKDSILDCDLDIKAAPISFKGYAMTVDFDNVTIIGRGNWNQDTYLEFNNGVHGTFNNCQFKAGAPRAQGDGRGDSGKVEIVGDTTNLEFIGCEFTERGSDKGSVVTVTSGTVKFSGGTVVNGGGSQNSALVINGGNVTTDDAVIKGDKGDNPNKMPLKINGGNVKFGKTAIIRGTSNGANSVICNSNDALKAALMDGYTFFKSSEISGENAYIYNDNVDYTKEKVIYIDKCEHWNSSATCTTDGNCYYCNKAISALGHDYSAYDSDETNHWKVCDRCFETDPNSVPEAHTGGTATCVQAKECEVCGALYGKANGHDFSAGEYACDAENHWIKCANCSTGKKDVTPHTEEIAADCTNSAKCSVCKLIYGNPLGHNFQNYVYNNDVSCTTAGTETGVCTRCNEEDTRKSSAHPPLGHDWIDMPDVAATCTTEGSTGGQQCSRCNIISTTNPPQVVPIDPNAHVWNSGVIENKVDCKHDQEARFTCTLCSKQEVMVIGKGEHNWANPVVIKEATCTSTGLYKYTCSVCQETKMEEIPANANKHTWNSGVVITPNTCVSNGSIERTCTSCGKKTTEVLFASSSAHKYSDNFTVDKAATLFATGLKSRHCVYCNGKTNSTVVGKLKFTVKIKAGKGSFKVTSKKYAKVAGYQVKYKLGKKTFKKTFNTKKALKKTIKKLKKGTYKVQVRAFTKKGKTKVYSKWTASKKVKVK